MEQLDEKFKEVKEILTTEEFNDFEQSLKNSFKDHVSPLDGEVNIEFRAFYPKSYYKTIEIIPSEFEFVKNLDQLGEGTKNLILLSLFRAYVETFPKCTVFLIEEPEFCIDDVLTTEYDNVCLDDFMNSQPENSVFEFYRMLKKKVVELYKDGCRTMKDVPESIKLNDKQAIQKRLCFDGGVHINKQGINNFLRNLQYPIYYLDFETINPILPKFNGMKAYQRIPFQFSLHIQEEKGGKLKHISFLADGTSDPRPKFMQALKDNLGDKGSVLVYNQGFEKGVMNECATAFPEFREWYDENILSRIKDLWDVFRNFDYYDSRQKGSCSIKYVLPVMSDLSYKNLEHVKKGDEASYQWERVTFNEVPEGEKQKIRDALEKYCCLDTLAEVKIVDKLYEVVED